MNVLVDTSVWVGHFRHGNKTLAQLLEADMVFIHPMVIAEVACGTPPEPRARTLASFKLLQSCQQATLHEVMTLIENEKLYGQGCGLVDMALLASTLITANALLWTLDKRLVHLAQRFHVAFAAA